MFGRERIEYKTVDQLRPMRRAGLVVAKALAATREQARPGMTTAELDRVAADVIAAAGATSNFLGYHGFPATTCISVNDQIVHGIPGPQKLAAGDVVSVDCGAIVAGWHADSAISFVLGGDDAADPKDVDLVAATRRAMWAGIAATARGARVGDIGTAIEASVQESPGGYGIVWEYTGHGIGTAMHQAPEVPNYGSTRGARLRPGMCLAIEPMLTRGAGDTRVLADEWTTVTQDGSRAAHWEHSVAIWAGGIWVLTAEDGGAADLGRLGITPAAPEFSSPDSMA